MLTNNVQPIGRKFHARKAHSKSRECCDTCKTHRKKCDESNRECWVYLRGGHACHYFKAGNWTRGVGFTSVSPSPLTILPLYGDLNIPPSESELFHHFKSHTLASIGSYNVQRAIASCLSTAPQLDYLKHAIFAVTALHLSLVYDKQFYYQRMQQSLDKALHGFRQTLTSPLSPSQTDASLQPVCS